MKLEALTRASVRCARGVVAALMVLAVFGAMWAEPASAQRGDEPSELEALPDWLILPDPRLHPTLLRIAVSSPTFDDEVATYEFLRTALDDARAAIAAGQAERDELELDRRSLERRVEALRAERRSVILQLDEIRSAIRQLAIASYMGSGSQAEEEVFSLNAGKVVLESRRQTFVSEVRDGQGGRQAALEAEAATLGTDLDAASGELAAITRRIVELDAEVEGQARIAYVALQEVPDAARRVREARLSGVVAGTDMPLIALNAYVKAAERLAEERRGCGITWWDLAGVGVVESNHGRFAGTELSVDGDTDTPIVGLALDGTEGLALIADSDGGLLDGDPVLDRAVGPMQFIPQTWYRYESDGNDDEVSDPNNIYDAALAAARYLCAVGVDVRIDEGKRRAFFAYNHREEYVETVYANAVRYSTFGLPRPPRIDFEGLAIAASEIRVQLPSLGLGFLGGEAPAGELTVPTPPRPEDLDLGFLDDPS